MAGMKDRCHPTLKSTARKGKENGKKNDSVTLLLA
jgi:hypothetical protein